MIRNLLCLILVLALASAAFATIKSSADGVAAQNTFIPPILMQGVFNLSISGTWTGTVTLQRSFDKGTTWLDVGSYASNVESNAEFEAETGVYYRAGFKTSNYSNGTAVIRISQ